MGQGCTGHSLERRATLVRDILLTNGDSIIDAGAEKHLIYLSFAILNDGYTKLELEIKESAMFYTLLRSLYPSDHYVWRFVCVYRRR